MINHIKKQTNVFFYYYAYTHAMTRLIWVSDEWKLNNKIFLNNKLLNTGILEALSKWIDIEG